MPEPWERQEKESDPAWEAFTVYRDMGAERSLAKTGQHLGKSTVLMEGWSVKHGWVRRAAAWDMEQDRLWRESLVAERRKMAERQARIGAMAEGKIAQFIVELDPRTLTASEAARWLEVASRLQHQVLGVPQRVEVSGPDGGPMQVESMSPEQAMQRLREVQAQIGEVLGESGEAPV